MLTVLPFLLLACEDFFEEDLSHDQVEIVAPSDGVSVYPGEITFLWSELKGATSYRITIVSPRFDEAGTVVGDEWLKNDTVTRHRSYSCKLGPGDYQWSLRALNSAYSTPEKISSLHIIDTARTAEGAALIHEIGHRP